MSKEAYLGPERNMDHYNLVQRAKKGDPGALREILTLLAKHLRGHNSLTPSCAQYSADCLEAFIDSSVMKDADREYTKLITKYAKENFFGDAETESDCLIANLKFRHDLSKGGRPRIPQEAQRADKEAWSQKLSLGRIGRAFCQAFNLSPPSKKGECPEYVESIEDFLYVGESQTHAIKIVRSAVESPLSASQIRRWLKRKDIRKENLDPREIRLRTLNELGFVVEHYLNRDFDFEIAVELTARRFVITRFREATVFLKPSTVKAAYKLAFE